MRVCWSIMAVIGCLLLGCSSDDETDFTDTSTRTATDAQSDVLPTDTGGNPDTGTPEDTASEPLNAVPTSDPGPYRVGYAVEQLTYRPNPDVGERTIRVARWYPTSDTEGSPPNYVGIIPRPDILIDATAITDVSPSGQPIMIYSHGNFGFAEASFFVAEHFASHGWLVLAPDHTGNTFTDFSVARTTRTFLTRSQDLSACLDRYAKDADRVVAMGHSFGGYTALSIAGATHDLAQCEGDSTSDFCSPMDADERAAFAQLHDPRVDLAIPMSGGNAVQLGPNGSGVADIDVPVFLMTARLDIQVTDAANGDPYWAALDSPDDRRLELTTGGHQSWAVTCEYFGTLMPGDGCEGEEFIQPTVAWDLVNAYALAFARFHLTGDQTDADLLDGLRSINPDAVIQLP